ncbi:hypothetical protein WA026_023171 [Henosepilachna vigintioctopunctata]|uniref:ABC transporter domain-containing protein n=1 Tax=Henosepilachna vigintioctopunctata TaxID=420089 RepID=A0AAW1UTA3_9CUCU
MRKNSDDHFRFKRNMTGVRCNIERNSDQQMSNEELKRRQCTWVVQNDFVERIPVDKQILFSWCNINLYKDDSNPGSSSTDREKILPQEKQILANVSGNANPGELLVIMGPSGAGKTTLLNCMTFRNLKNFRVSGLICINNLPVRQIQLASQSAYVQQDDIFIEYLTVREHLIFQSLVKMESHFSYDERLDRVERVMKELSLKKCEHCSIGLPGIKKSISGGERKDWP